MQGDGCPERSCPAVADRINKKDKAMEMIEEKNEQLTERKWADFSFLSFFFKSAVTEPDDSEGTHYCCRW